MLSLTNKFLVHKTSSKKVRRSWIQRTKKLQTCFKQLFSSRKILSNYYNRRKNFSTVAMRFYNSKQLNGKTFPNNTWVILYNVIATQLIRQANFSWEILRIEFLLHLHKPVYTVILWLKIMTVSEDRQQFYLQTTTEETQSSKYSVDLQL